MTCTLSLLQHFNIYPNQFSHTENSGSMFLWEKQSAVQAEKPQTMKIIWTTEEAASV
jgi:hypothetical protein